MRRAVAFLAAWVGISAFSAAEAPRIETVQGFYEGTITDAGGQHKAEARLVALGKGNYKLLIRQSAAEGKVTKIELAGKTSGEEIQFAGKAAGQPWAGKWEDSYVKGTTGAGGKFEFKRVERQSPTLGAAPPEGAIVLLDGKNFDEVTSRTQEWKTTGGGAIVVPKGGMSSKRTFDGSLKIHVEFKNPLMPEATGQGRGNSGVYLPNGSEIQVLDSFGMTTYTGGGCGGLYRYKDPDAFDEFSLASAPPLQWQTYDIEYRVEKKDGKLVGKPRVTVYHNGIRIHDNAELSNNAKVGVLNFQDHGNAVEYRNIWVVPLDQK